MKFLVAGDIHGRVQDLAWVDNYAAHRNIPYVIQVGDLGAYWPGEQCKIDLYFRKRHKQKRKGPIWITCLGNHDNWNKWEKSRWVQAIKLGYTKEGQITHYPDLIEYAPGLFATNRPVFLDICGGMAFCGGAVSSDADAIFQTGWDREPAYKGRIENLDWWRQEAPTQKELDNFLNLIETKKPRYVFTHDGPSFAHQKRRSGINLKTNLHYNYCSHQYEAMTRVMKHFPEYWFYGHHHELVSKKVENTMYACCGFHGQGWIVDTDLTYIQSVP